MNELKILGKDTLAFGKNQVRDLLEILSRSPSPDNCQPWEINQTEPFVVKLKHWPQIDKHKMNCIGLATNLCLGAMIESARIWADRWDRNMEVEIGEETNEFGQKQRIAKLDFSQASRQGLDPLSKLHYDRLLLRRTHRGVFSASSIKPNLSEIVQIVGERFTRIQFQFLQPTKFINDLIKEVETSLWANQKFCRDLFKWFRFRAQTYRKLRDGLFHKELGIPFHEVIGLSLFYKFPWLFAMLSFFTQFGVRNNLDRTFKNCKGLAMISVKSEDFTSQIEAGSVALRIWLELESQGFSVQPCSLASFALYYSRFSPEFFNDLSQLESNIQRSNLNICEELNLKEPWVPIWWFRTGVGHGIQSVPKSLRKNVPEVL